MNEAALPPGQHARDALVARGIALRPRALAPSGSLERWQQMRDACAVRGELLRDAQGSVLLLFAADTLLDLDALNARLRRELEVLPRADARQFCDRAGFTEPPGVPGLVELATVVDSGLLARASHFCAGGGEELLELRGEEFAALLPAACERVACTVEVARCMPPADDAGDRDAIARSVGRLTRLAVDRKLQNTLRLPPLPETARRIVQISRSPVPDIEALARAVELDPSLAAQVMGWALSPRYAAGRQVNSIRDAIFRVLGSEMVLNFALGVALGRTLKLPRIERPGKLGYWQQAMYCAALMERLAREVDVPDAPGPGTAYLTGLLHNFGYLVLGAVYGEHFRKCCRYEDANRHLGSREVEQHVLGVTREQMAAVLLQEWGLPPEVCHAVRHGQGDAPSAPLANLLCVATALLREHFLTDRTPLPAPPARVAALGLDAARLAVVRDAALENASHLDTMARQIGG